MEQSKIAMGRYVKYIHNPHITVADWQKKFADGELEFPYIWYAVVVVTDGVDRAILRVEHSERPHFYRGRTLNHTRGSYLYEEGDYTFKRPQNVGTIGDITSESDDPIERALNEMHLIALRNDNIMLESTLKQLGFNIGREL